MQLLSLDDTVSFWPDEATCTLPFQIAIMRQDGVEQRGSFPSGEKPDWNTLREELRVSRAGYGLLRKGENGRVSVELLSGRLIVEMDLSTSGRAPRFWLKKNGRGIRFAGNRERTRFLGNGVPLRHEGIWVGNGQAFRAQLEGQPFFASGDFVRVLESALSSQRPAAAARTTEVAVAPSRAEEVALLRSLTLMIDAEYELEQREAQAQAGFHFFAAQPEARRSTVKRYFRLSLVEDDHQRLLAAGNTLKMLCLEQQPGQRLQLELEDSNPHPGSTEILVSSPRQATIDDVPSSGVLTSAASAKQYEARSRAVEALRLGEASNRWLVAAAAGSHPQGDFTLLPYVPPADGFLPNPSQVEAIVKGLSSLDYTLVLGPPGTGKTTVISSWVGQLVNDGKRVLITSHGNRAVDNVLERVARDKQLTCVRLGNESKLSTSMRELLIDNCAVELQRTIASSITERWSGVQHVLSQYDRMLSALEDGASQETLASELRGCRQVIASELAPLRHALDLDETGAFAQSLAALLESAGAIGSQLALGDGFASRGGFLWLWYRLKAFLHKRRAAALQQGFEAERQALLELATTHRHRLAAVASVVSEWHEMLTNQRQQGLYPLLLQLVDVVGATCIGIDTNRYFGEQEFDVVIVDEAGQIQLHNLAVPMTRAKKVILVGDHKQLPPIASKELLEELQLRGELEQQPPDPDLLKKSWFELMWEVTRSNRKVMLDTQFRCPAVISDFISEAFYDSRYFAGDAMKSKLPLLPVFDSALLFIDTSQLPARQRYEQTQDGKVTGNRAESELALSVLQYFTSRLPELLEQNEVGIIAPLRNHVAEIQRGLLYLKAQGELSGLSTPPAELAATVDSYQGQERDLIIYAAGRSNPRGEIGFLKDWRRLNVAMTRAKRQLVMIGDLDTLARPTNRPEDQSFKTAMNVLIRHLQTKGQLIPASVWWREVGAGS